MVKFRFSLSVCECTTYTNKVQYDTEYENLYLYLEKILSVCFMCIPISPSYVLGPWV